ncbi:ParB/RepB/Spo0J family partition protein [Pseudaestuariivita sp.]|uniref:ParB/RepB/Spo0J family partition protein n=1 Tax=Pseudaestuariivita sp. TaxID=2211669 RepID=UPI004058C68A
MAELIQKTTMLDPAEIKTVSRLRPTSASKVKQFVELIAGQGFVHPIVVRKKQNAGWVLIDGAHRLSAARSLGLEEVPVRAYRCNDREATEIEVASNLAAGMTALEQAIFLAEAQVLYEERHPEAKHGASNGKRTGIAKKASMPSFIANVARERSCSPRYIGRLAQIGRSFTSDQVEKLASAKKAPGVQDLLSLAQLDEEARATACEAFSNGSCNTLRKAINVQTAKRPGAVRPPETLNALLLAWKRASQLDRRKFVAKHRDAIQALIDEPSK